MDCVLISFLISIPNINALPDNLYIAMEPDKLVCFDIVLPDDMDVIVPGKIEYRILLNPPSSEETWATLTEVVVRTDENNTVVVPICFSTYGKRIGQCSEKFTLTITGNDLPAKTFEGGVCVSELPDIDTEKISGNETEKGLSDVNLFDMEIKKPVKFSTPNVPVNYTVMIQSYADITIDLDVESNGRLIVSKKVDFKEEEYKEVNFTLKARNTGIYNFSIIARVKNCDGSFCVKEREGQLIVKNYLEREGGFTVSLFPKNINVKNLVPVEYRLTITNNGFENDEFEINIQISDNLTADFQKKVVKVPVGYEKTIKFNVTPQSVSSLFNITAVVTSGDVIKKDTAYLSTNEMLTDMLRRVERNESDANKLNEWYSLYINSNYGDEVDEYAELNEEINTQNIVNEDYNNDKINDNIRHNKYPLWYVFLAVPIAALVFIILFVVSKLKSRGNIETKQYY